MTEAELQSAVVKLARLRGFEVYHTAVSQFSAAGFPDLILLRADKMLVRELKSAKGKLTDAQEKWLDLFRLSGHDAKIWRPENLEDGTIAFELSPAWRVA